ncbi:serine/threonine-protein kinase [Nonomuraea sediminis]|uniref:serine/threonine-protein kinase n=1 Tax=Nonomuraea sediminis TaxID=2835864 RepID=UPI001BDC3562|nr:serine/threonine-protein kinase [Nonomuraea sediminis]
MDLRPGDPDLLAGYTLDGFLGEGGQGTVYAGEAPDGTRVAVKVLHARFAGDAEAVRRFRREIDMARQVAQFCTARVLDAGVEGGLPYLVSEFVESVPLEQAVRERGPLKGDDLTRLAVGTMTALVAIHRAGIVHRDFKPKNVLLAADGPRVIDFGIATTVDSTSVTGGTVVGSPAYMAPEQIQGAAVGPAADVFGWAGTMVFAATGKPAFGSDSIPAVLNRVLNTVADLSEVPEPLRPLLAACLHKDPAARPAAADVLMRLMGATLDEVVPDKAPETPVTPPKRGSAGRARMAIAAASTAALGALAVAAFALPHGPQVMQRLPNESTLTGAPVSASRHAVPQSAPATRKTIRPPTTHPPTDPATTKPATKPATSAPPSSPATTAPPTQGTPTAEPPRRDRYGWGLVPPLRIGKWKVFGPKTVAAAGLDGERRDDLLRVDPLPQGTYHLRAQLTLLERGSTAAAPRYGVLVAVSGPGDYAEAYIDLRNKALTTHAWTGGASSPWQSTKLPAGFDPRTSHAVKVIRNGDTFTFVLDGVPLQTRTFKLPQGGRAGLTTLDCRARFENLRIL